MKPPERRKERVMSKQVWTTECPGVNYREPEVKDERCGTCTHSEVTNAGANIPGFQCQLLRRIFKEAGMEEEGNPCVNSRLGICDKYKFWKDAERESAAEKVRGADI